jgi:hypothetical protein
MAATTTLNEIRIFRRMVSGAFFPGATETKGSAIT